MSNRWINVRVNLTVLCTATYTTDDQNNPSMHFLIYPEMFGLQLFRVTVPLKNFSAFQVLLLKHINTVKC